MSKRWGIVLGVFLVLVVLVGRIVWMSRAEFAKGQQAQVAGLWEEAILHYDRAIHWYAPGNVFCGRAIESLWSLGQNLEEKNPKMALLAYDSIRGGIFAVRHLFRPHQKWLPQVNARIAHLRATEQIQGNSSQTFEQALAFHQKALALDEQPVVGWALVMELGFLGWVGCTFAWIFLGFGREGKMHFSSSLPWMIGLVFFFVLWLVGLKLA